MEYYIEKEFKLNDFKPWAWALTTYEEIENLDIMEEAQEYIEEMFDGVEVVTDIDINDMLWFGMDEFIADIKEQLDEEEEE